MAELVHISEFQISIERHTSSSSLKLVLFSASPCVCAQAIASGPPYLFYVLINVNMFYFGSERLRQFISNEFQIYGVNTKLVLLLLLLLFCQVLKKAREMGLKARQERS